MIKKLPFLIFLFTLAKTHAQIVNIPDQNFKNALLYHYTVIDTNSDGEIQYSEAANVTHLGLNGTYNNPGNIENIMGIEAFTNIVYLGIDYQQITTADLSNNIHLERISAIDVNLNSIDVTNCTQLKELYCQNEFNSTTGLTSLDVSNCPLLEKLNVSYHHLTGLDVSNNVNLKSLMCDANNLTNLDISNNVLLESLNCGENDISSLDVSNNTLLKNLGTSNNSSLGSLDVSNNTALESLSCQNNQLTTLDVTSNPNLRQLLFPTNQISSIDVSNNPDLENLTLGGNPLVEIDLSNNPNIEYFTAFLNDFVALNFSNNSNLITVTINSNPNLVAINLKNGNNENIEYISLQNLSNLETFCLDDVNSDFAEVVESNISVDVEIQDVCTMDVEDFSTIEYSVFPNPTEAIVYINSSKPILQIEVFDHLGRLVMEKFNEDFIDINTLSKGLYFLKISDTMGNFGIKKVQKN